MREPNVTIDGEPEVSPIAQLVSGGYFAGLSVDVLLGRTITATDDRAGAPSVALISQRYWLRRFGGDLSVLGKSITVNRATVTIIGVTRPEFLGTLDLGTVSDVYLPLALMPSVMEDAAERAQPSFWWVRVMGRLNSGATRA